MIAFGAVGYRVSTDVQDLTTPVCRSAAGTRFLSGV